MSKNKNIICKKQGYGIIIKGKLICKSCETKVIECDLDSEFYKFYKNRLKEEIYTRKSV